MMARLKTLEEFKKEWEEGKAIVTVQTGNGPAKRVKPKPTK